MFVICNAKLCSPAMEVDRTMFFVEFSHSPIHITHLLFYFQSRADSGSRRNNMYYGTPFYGGYGYASPVPHPNMYAAAYGAYPVYGSQQLVS